MTFTEFIDLDPKRSQEREMILGAYLSYLNDLSQQNYPIGSLVQFRSYCDVFLDALSYKNHLLTAVKDDYRNLGNKLLENLKLRSKILHKSLISRLLFFKINEQGADQIVSDTYEQLLTKTIELISKAKEPGFISSHLSIGDFYTPDNSNKPRINELINDAIELLNQDSTINEKCKQKIVDYLKRALDELQSNHTDWSLFLGKLKETIIILGAIGSFAGGVSVIAAREKIEEASDVVQKTSITMSFKSINETINIQNAPKLENFQYLLQLDAPKNQVDTIPDDYEKEN